MTDPWHTLPALLPVDGSTVWIRISYPSLPFLAVWTLATGTFTHASGLSVPWWAAVRWRNQ